VEKIQKAIDGLATVTLMNVVSFLYVCLLGSVYALVFVLRLESLWLSSDLPCLLLNLFSKACRAPCSL